MGMFGKDRKPTKKSYLGNGILAFVLGILMIISALMNEAADAEYFKGVAVGVGILWLLGVYWIRKHLAYDADQQNARTGKMKQVMDKLGL